MTHILLILYDTYTTAKLYKCSICNIQIVIDRYMLGVHQNNINKGCISVIPVQTAMTIYDLFNDEIIKQRHNYLILSCKEEIIKNIIE